MSSGKWSLVVVLAVLIGTGSVWVVLTNGLVAHWKLDGDAIDSAGSNDGTIYGAAWTTGQIGGALSFDGVDDYVEVSGFAYIPPPFTIMAWVKRGVIADNKYRSFVSKGAIYENNTNFDFGIRDATASNHVYLVWRNGSTFYGQRFYLSNAYNNEFFNVVAVVNSSYDLEMFVNGQSVGTDTGNSAPGDGGHALRIGKWSGTQSASEEFKGDIDDVRIYNTALSAEEIEELYESGLAFREYKPSDINEDYYVDLKDFAYIADAWLECTDPVNADCDQYWK